MEKPFDDIHADIKSQVLGTEVLIKDSEDVVKAREIPPSYDGYLKLGKALSRQLRYREAIEAYTKALDYRPFDKTALRLRAGRYLTTLQTESAILDFEKCLFLGGNEVDCRYRMGLAHYFAGEDIRAMKELEECFPLCDDEMGIAVIYWHTLSAARAGFPCKLLRQYHRNMKVGHHTGYELAMQVWVGEKKLSMVLRWMEDELDDMEYAIVMYGLCQLPKLHQKKEGMLYDIVKRDEFWPCFSYMAAWKELRETS